MRLVGTTGMLWVTLQLFVLCQASDWPTYMKDRGRVGFTTDGLPEQLTNVWTYQSAEPPHLSWPGPGGKVIEGLKLEHRVRYDDVFHVAISGGQVYFGSSVDNTAYCLDLASGRVQWTYVTGAPIRLAPTVESGHVYLGSDDGFVYCLNADNGSLVWKLRAGPRDERILARARMTSRWPVRTGVLVDQDVAYFGAGVFPHENIFIYAVDAKTGMILWKNDTVSQQNAGRDDLTPQGYLLATDDILYVPSGRTLPAAFDRQTGQLLHKQKGGGKQVGGVEALLDDDHLLSIGEHHVLALDQQSGDIDNRYRGRQMTYHGPMAYFADGKELVAIQRQHLVRSKQQRLDLEKALADQQRLLRRHTAPIKLKRVQDTQAQLAGIRQTLKRLASDGSGDATAYRNAKNKEAKLVDDLASYADEYEVARKDYQQVVDKLDQARERVEQFASGGIKWKVETPLESAMILANNKIVVGGIGQFAVFDSGTGRKLQSHQVDGEVRGLAVSDGSLVVSTTAGKVYCFAIEGTSKPGNSIASEPNANPFPRDDKSELYANAAQQILSRTGVRRGYCLVVGSDEGRLAYELAMRSGLMVYGLESDPAKVARSRAALARAGMYGSRVTIDQADLQIDPLPNYFANLIVSDSFLLDGKLPGNAGQIARHLKPEGGVMCLGFPRQANVPDDTLAKAQDFVAQCKLPDETPHIKTQNNWVVLRRQSLPGVAAWGHQYGNAANTSSVPDMRVRGGVSVLWYGDPGPSKMLNRHVGAVGPVSAAGRLFIQGDESIMAYDAYNGVKLWENKNPGALRTGVFNNYEPGNTVASSDYFFMVVGPSCQQLKASTGELVKTHYVPGHAEDESREWGYVGLVENRLYGTSTVRKMVVEEARRRGRPSEADNTDQIFCIDINTGEQLWSYTGKSISHTTIAIDDQRLYFVDSTLTPEQRETLLRQDKSELSELTGDARQLAEDRMKRIDARLAVGLDAVTGETEWSQPVDVTDCTGVGIGAGRLTLMAAKNFVVLCGANANGHYWKQFLAGEFKRRRLVVLSAETGEKVWAKDANYRHRPIVIGDRIIAEPWSFYLHSGQQEFRVHPLTGQQTPWKFIRPGHHCGAISATPGMMFFRSLFTAYYDLETDSGTHHFGGHRLGCWINTIPANGLVMVPEASAGCACLFSLTSTIVFEPRESRQVWGVYSAEGASTPVQHMALNLGAPGDRRDAHGKLWLSYPRPASRPGLDLPLDIRPMTALGTDGAFTQQNDASYTVDGTDTPWLFASGVRGMTRCELPLIDEGQEPATYTVRLYFAAPEDDQPEKRVFDVALQGEIVARELDVVVQAEGPSRAFVLEQTDIPVSAGLAIELIPRTNPRQIEAQPILCAVEVLRTGAKEIISTVAANR